jgi:hypothetical protein
MDTEFIQCFLSWYKKEQDIINYFKTNGKLPFIAKKHNIIIRGCLHLLGGIFCWPCCAFSFMCRKCCMKNDNQYVIYITDKCMLVMFKEAGKSRNDLQQFIELDFDQHKNVRDVVRRLLKEWSGLLELCNDDQKKCKALSYKIISLVDVLYKHITNLEERKTVAYLATKIRLLILLSDYKSIVPISKTI